MKIDEITQRLSAGDRLRGWLLAMPDPAFLLGGPGLGFASRRNVFDRLWPCSRTIARDLPEGNVLKDAMTELCCTRAEGISACADVQLSCEVLGIFYGHECTYECTRSLFALEGYRKIHAESDA